MGQHQTGQRKHICSQLCPQATNLHSRAQMTPDASPAPIFHEAPSSAAPWSVSICPTVEIHLALEENTLNKDLPTINELPNLPSK